MAGKKHGFGTALLIGASAAAVVGGVISYIKRAEIKRLADEIITRVRPTDTDGVYAADLDGDGRADFVMADLDGDGRIDVMAMDAGELNIVDSGISLESVEKTSADDSEATEPEAGEESVSDEAAAAEPETSATDEEQAEDDDETEAGLQEAEDDGVKKKKIKFWSK